MKNNNLFFFLFLPLFILTTAHAQSTYNQVYNLFQANCTVGCHSGTSPSGNLNLGADTTTVYANLINVNPINPAALAAGNKLIVPGNPHYSFLLRKCLNGLDPDAAITQAEGDPMPNNTTPLPKNKIELIRQWILHGAPQTGVVVDTALINTFYRGKGIIGISTPPPAVTVPGTYRVHLGKIFLAPNSESEYFIKQDLKLPDTLQVNRIDMEMAPQSHHFIIYKILPGFAGYFPEGLRLQNPLTGANSSNGYNTLVCAWQTNYNDILPTGTAYSWEKSTVLDLNYHIRNSNMDSVLGVDVYFDYYTQPKNTPVNIMYSELLMNTQIAIPANNQPFTFTHANFDPTAMNNWNIWLLSSHTHKYGTEFQIFLRNPDGSQGTQVFEGFYDTFYNFNQGYYDWEHPPVEHFNPMLTINPRNGMIQKATYKNTGTTPVTFGLTTKDEMMLFFVQYTLGSSLEGIHDPVLNKAQLTIYPNPFTKNTQLNYTLTEDSKVQLDIFNMIGEKVASPISNIQQSPGAYNFNLNSEEYHLSNGIYLIKLSVNGENSMQKILLSN